MNLIKSFLFLALLFVMHARATEVAELSLKSPESKIALPKQDRVLHGLALTYEIEGVGDYSNSITESGLRVGFHFINSGGNGIIAKKVNSNLQGAIRQFNFEFLDRARQDIHLEVVDYNEYIDGRDRQNMYSDFYFFRASICPRFVGQSKNQEQKFLR